MPITLLAAGPTDMSLAETIQSLASVSGFVVSIIAIGVPLVTSGKTLHKRIGISIIITAITAAIVMAVCWYGFKNGWQRIRNWWSILNVIYPIVYITLYVRFLRSRKRAERQDREWSDAPDTFIKVRMTECVIGIKDRAIKVDFLVSNKFRAQRSIWISGNVAIYRSGLDKPICIIPLCICSIDVPADLELKITQPLHSIIPAEYVAEIESIYAIDKELSAKIVDAQITTLVHLTSVPVTATLNPQALLMQSVPVKVCE